MMRKELAEEQKEGLRDDDHDCSESSDEEDEQEPADLVDVIKPCKWCKSSITRFCRPIDRGSHLLEYQCDDCSFFFALLQDIKAGGDLKGAQRSNSRRRRYMSLRSSAKPNPAAENYNVKFLTPSKDRIAC